MSNTVQLATQPKPIAVVPEETALIVVDTQNACLSPDGYINLVGSDVSESHP